MADVGQGVRPSATSREGFSLPRLSGSAFGDLAVWMVGLGIATGLCFPLCVLALGVPAERALTVRFFAATVSAGLLVSGLNFLLARGVVGRRLRIMNLRMHSVREEVAAGGVPEDREIAVDSTDEFGVSAAAFNALLRALVQARRARPLRNLQPPRRCRAAP
jgi:HAMP domain-containing protein